MANAAYATGLAAFAQAGVDWQNDTIKVAACTSAYAYSAAHEFYTSLAGILAEATLGTKTSTGGVLDAADTLLAGLSAGAINSLVVFKWTGSGATSKLLFYFDTGVNFDLTPSGDVLVIWPEASGVKIFPLGGLAA